MSCRSGMLTTMRRWAVRCGERFREAIFSMVGLLGLTSIPPILGKKEATRVDRKMAEEQALTTCAPQGHGQCPGLAHEWKLSGAPGPRLPRGREGWGAD